MLTIYHNPRCRKSRETLKLIEESGNMVQVVEYLKMPPSKDELRHILELLNMEPEQLVRKGEAVYKENFKGKSMSSDEWLEALVKYPKLIERPIVVSENSAILGRPPENVRSLL